MPDVFTHHLSTKSGQGQTIFCVQMIVLLVGICGCMQKSENQAFDQKQWSESRQSNPDLNISPRMLDDLMTKHLQLGMQMTDVTALLGPAETMTPSGTGVSIQGESLKYTVYVYQPGIHNTWELQGSNSLVLYFDRNESLRTWSPLFPVVQPTSATASEATRNLPPDGRLDIGNDRFAGYRKHFDVLLGPPDQMRTETELEYYLGKLSRFAAKGEYLQLHFDESNRLSRITRLKH
ncbi:MAG: hypothetical protein EXS35_07630 [Pedosphaera sp.]|nr:hypothetical protein [Pedosphaera sp.]